MLQMRTLRYAALVFASTAVAFGLFGWRWPIWSRRPTTHDAGLRPGDASARDPAWKSAYRPDVATSSATATRRWGVAIALIVVAVGAWLLIALLA